MPAKRFAAITREHLGSYPTPEEHLTRLQKLGACLMLVCGQETITDCTVPNIASMLPGRISSDGTTLHNTIVLEGASHNLKGFCQEEVPAIILDRIACPVPGLTKAA